MARIGPIPAETRRVLIRTALWLLALLLVLPLIALALTHVQREAVYAGEGSIIEWVSVVQWGVLAVAMPLILRRVSVNIVAGMVVLLACAAREVDWHKRFTGYSVLKPKFYLSDEFPLMHRLVAAVLVGLFALSLAMATRAVWMHAARDGFLRAKWVRLVGFAFILTALSKVVDRAPAMLEDLGMKLPRIAFEMAKAFEENAEVLLPFILTGAAVLYGRERRRSRAA